MSYKHISDKDDHFIMHHKDGHEIKIAKKALSKKTLGKLQQFASGGEVTKDEADKFTAGFNSQTTKEKPKSKTKTTQYLAYGDEVKDPTLGLEDPNVQSPQNYSPASYFQTPKIEEQTQDKSIGRRIGESISPIGSAVSEGVKDALGAYGNLASGVGKFVGDLAGGVAGTPVQRQPIAQPAVMTEETQAQSVPANASLGNATPMQGVNTAAEVMQAQGVGPGIQLAGLQQQSQALAGQADIEAKQAGQLAKQYEEGIKQIQDLRSRESQELDVLGKERDQLQTEIKNQELDPRRMFNNMGTGQKVMTAIGLVLSGMGSGLTGQPNAAMAFMNKMMDQDLDAQKTNLGKKQSLLDYNLKKTGNLQDAYKRSKLDMLTVMDARVQQVLNSNAGPMAKQKAAALQGKIMEEMGPLAGQIASSQAFAKQASMGGGTPERTATLMVRNLPKEDQKGATEEIEMMTGYKNAVNSVDDIFNEVAGMSAAGSSIPITKQNAAFDSAVSSIELKLRGSMKGQGSLTDKDVDAMRSLFPTRADLLNTDRLNVKKERIKEYLSNKISGGTPVLTRYGINLPLPVKTRPVEGGPKFQQIGYKK